MCAKLGCPERRSIEIDVWMDMSRGNVSLEGPWIRTGHL